MTTQYRTLDAITKDVQQQLWGREIFAPVTDNLFTIYAQTLKARGTQLLSTDLYTAWQFWNITENRTLLDIPLQDMGKPFIDEFVHQAAILASIPTTHEEHL